MDTESGKATVVEPPTPGQGARRVWPDSHRRLWVSEWTSGQLSRYEPATGNWQAWKLPGDKPRASAVYVDAADNVSVTDFRANAVLRFDPHTARFERFPSDRRTAATRHMSGREGAVWVPEGGP